MPDPTGYERLNGRQGTRSQEVPRHIGQSGSTL